jgi:hypothetical protein
MFKSNLIVQELPGGKKQLTLPLIYQEGEEAFIVPVGFTTDYASIPRVPLIYLVFEGTANYAATLHDFLYSSKEVSRVRADNIFLNASIGEGTPKWKAYCMFYAVRLCGKGVRKTAYGFIHE